MQKRFLVLPLLGLCAASCALPAASVSTAPPVAALATVPVGKAPIYLAMAPDGSRLYAAAADGNLAVIDTSTRAAVATVAVPPFTSGIAVSPDGSRVFAANLFGGELTVLNTANNTLGPALPLISTLQRGGYGRVAVAPDGSSVYVANQTNRMFVQVNLGGGPPTALTPDMAPIDLAFTPDGQRLLLAGCKNFCAPGAVLPFTVGNGDFGRVSYVGSKPYRIVVSSDGTRAYLANLGGSTISVLETASLSEVGQVQVGAVPTALALTADGRRLYAASDDASTVTAIDTATRTVAGSARVGGGAREIAVSSDGQILFVSTAAGVVVLEARTIAP